MVKKVNSIGVTVKTLLQEGRRTSQISRELKISKQSLNDWIKTPIKTIQTCRKKLPKNLK